MGHRPFPAELESGVRRAWMLVHRPLNSLYFGWILCASLLLAASAPGGERTALQSSPGTQANNGGKPIWSVDLDSACLRQLNSKVL